jgi:hypothetical protein
MQHRRLWRRKPIAAFVALLALFVGLTTATAQVTPPTVVATLAPGESMTVQKTVTTPRVPAVADFYFLADTTGSMSGSIASVKASAAAIMTALSGAGTNSAFGAGDYKDFPNDPYAFNNCAAVATGAAGQTAAQTCINAWSAGGGGDTPEGQFFALHRLALHNDAAFRPTATKFVIWFGDAPGHDPVCDAINGSSDTHTTTEASLIAELVAAGIKVIAISTTSGPTGGLNADPKLSSSDYGACGAEQGNAGQAIRIAAATGGSVATGVAPGDVANAILAAIAAVPVTVTPQATCSTPFLTVTFAPPSQTVPAGSDAVFQETITLGTTATPGTYTCTVNFLINGQPATPPITQTITVTVRNTPCRVKANGQTLDATRGLDAYAHFQAGFPTPIGVVVHGDTNSILGNLTASRITGITCVGTSAANITGIGTTGTGATVNFTLNIVDTPGPFFSYTLTYPGYTSSGVMRGSVLIFRLGP